VAEFTVDVAGVNARPYVCDHPIAYLSGAPALTVTITASGETLKAIVFEDNTLLPYKNASGGGSNVDTFGAWQQMTRLFYANNTQLMQRPPGQYNPPTHLETMYTARCLTENCTRGCTEILRLLALSMRVIRTYC
jgi:hypothetical protein